MLSARLSWREGLSFAVETESGHRLTLDAAAQAGGADAGPRPMELLLSALGGCTGMDVISILRKMRQPVEAMEVRVEGDRADEHPKVFTALRVYYILKGEGLEPAKVEKAIRLSVERYCGVGNMLRKAAVIEYAYEVNGERFRLGDAVAAEPGGGEAVTAPAPGEAAGARDR